MENDAKNAQPDPQEEIGVLYYFGDPMCSWCWGFSPVLETIGKEYPELRRVTVMGGLRGGAQQPMPDDLAEMVQRAWVRIESVTGQPFNHDLWKRERPFSTTLPACRAVIAARLVHPTHEWPFMVGMFKAYYTKAMNPSKRETYLQVALGQGIDLDVYGSVLDSAEVGEALEKDLATTKQFGVTGFPTVMLQIKSQIYLIAPGYQSVGDLRRAINAVYDDTGIAFTRPESGLYS